eukprot:scaffold625_cov324-Pavlova_lutheri.AAC.146
MQIVSADDPWLPEAVQNQEPRGRTASEVQELEKTPSNRQPPVQDSAMTNEKELNAKNCPFGMVSRDAEERPNRAAAHAPARSKQLRHHEREQTMPPNKRPMCCRPSPSPSHPPPGHTTALQHGPKT